MRVRSLPLPYTTLQSAPVVSVGANGAGNREEIAQRYYSRALVIYRIYLWHMLLAEQEYGDGSKFRKTCCTLNFPKHSQMA